MNNTLSMTDKSYFEFCKWVSEAKRQIEVLEELNNIEVLQRKINIWHAYLSISKDKWSPWLLQTLINSAI